MACRQPMHYHHSVTPQPFRISFDSDQLRYHYSERRWWRTTEREVWHVPFNQVRLIGVYTTSGGPFADDFFMCFVTDEDACYEASHYAMGWDVVFPEMQRRLDAAIRWHLCNSTSLASRIIWPLAYEAKPLFDYSGVRTGWMTWLFPVVERQLSADARAVLSASG